MARGNTRVITDARVERIEFEGSEATGVRFTIGGRGAPSRTIKAGREIMGDNQRSMEEAMPGPFAEFIRVTQEGWAKGVSILHFLGGSAIEVAGDRAIAQTKMTISQRGLVEGVACDVVCAGRFYDFVVRHDGEWKLLHRQPIYEKDRLLAPLKPDMAAPPHALRPGTTQDDYYRGDITAAPEQPAPEQEPNPETEK